MPALERRGLESCLRVSAERMGSTVVLDLEGRLTIESDTHQLGEVAPQIARPGVRHVVLDLSGIWQIDCAGMGRLVELRNQVCRRGGSCTLINVEWHQKRLLELVGLLGIFDVSESRRQALVRWFAPRLLAHVC